MLSGPDTGDSGPVTFFADAARPLGRAHAPAKTHAAKERVERVAGTVYDGAGGAGGRNRSRKRFLTPAPDRPLAMTGRPSGTGKKRRP